MITTHGTCLRARAFAISLVLILCSFPVICQAQPGTKLWEVILGETGTFTPAIGMDGTIYVSCGTVNSTSLYSRMLHAISPQGTTNWTFLAGAPIRSSPALGKDGSIYFATSGGLYAINPAGVTNWILEYSGQLCSSPAVGADGTIYLVTRTNNPTISSLSTLRAISPAGIVNWSCAAGGGVWGEDAQFSSPSIGPDGSIYVGSMSGNLYCISRSGSTNWTFSLGSGTYSSPSIGNDGTIYIGSETGPVRAINANGSLRRTYPVSQVESTPVIDQAGNIYFGSRSRFFCFSSDGVAKWGANGISLPVSGSAAIAADGAVYVSSYFGDSLALNSVGSVLWYFHSGSAFASPLIGTNGTIYLVGDAKLYAFTGTAPPLNSAWPMFRRDVHNNARAVQRSIRTIKSLQDGSVELQLTGEIGRDYDVEASTNLMVWETLGSLNFSAPNTAFVDTSSTNFASRFYRLSTSQ